MSLKELTKNKHTEAERTPFMKAVLKKKIPLAVWRDFTFQKYSFYKIIEDKCRRLSLLGGIEGIERTTALYEDYSNMPGDLVAAPSPATADYIAYLDKLTEPNKLLAHLYVWHMGDLFGGQMIKEIVDAPHASLEFENVEELKTNMRTKLNDNMAPEANEAFDWAIKIMNEYNHVFAV
jgi:heme oxygenase